MVAAVLNGIPGRKSPDTMTIMTITVVEMEEKDVAEGKAPNESKIPSFRKTGKRKRMCGEKESTLLVLYY